MLKYFRLLIYPDEVETLGIEEKTINNFTLRKVLFPVNVSGDSDTFLPVPPCLIQMKVHII